MADKTSGRMFARAGAPLGQRLNRFRNLALQGAAELAAPPAFAQPRSEFYVEIGDGPPVFRRPEKPGEVEMTTENITHLAQKTGNAPIDLVFADNSCIDLKFKLPDGLLPELRQIIDNEIQFRSPFNEGASLWFWVAEELPDHRWQARAAVTLKEPVEKLLALLSEHDLPIGAVRREAKDTHFAAYPSWAGTKAANTDPKGLLKKLPATLKLSVLGALVFCISALALTIQNGFTQSRLSAQVDAARATISAQAQASAGLRSLDRAITQSTYKTALTGILSQLLPDGVWLDQLVIEDDTVTLIGFGPSAAEITRLLATLPELTDIRFASPVTRDNAQSLERFRIAATLVEAGS